MGTESFSYKFLHIGLIAIVLMLHAKQLRSSLAGGFGKQPSPPPSVLKSNRKRAPRCPQATPNTQPSEFDLGASKTSVAQGTSEADASQQEEAQEEFRADDVSTSLQRLWVLAQPHSHTHTHTYTHTHIHTHKCTPRNKSTIKHTHTHTHTHTHKRRLHQYMHTHTHTHT